MASNNADGQIVFNVQIDDSTVQEQVRETTREIERVGEAAEESGRRINSAGSEGGRGLELLETGAGAAAAGIAISKPANIIEGSSAHFVQPNYRAMDMAKMTAEAAPTPISGGELTIEASVTVIYDY